MNIFEIIAEQRIREAIENGDVTNLLGEGKPIKWQQNPFRPEGMGIVFDLLQNNGFTLPWIEKAPLDMPYLNAEASDFLGVIEDCIDACPCASRVDKSQHHFV